MKKLLIALMLFSASAFADGEIQNTLQEQIGNVPQGVLTYDRSCTGNGKPQGIPSVTARTGTTPDFTYTTTETCASANGCPVTKTWVSTTVISGGGTTYTTTCAELQ